MSDIKLSICIPTYNRSAYLRTALEHLEGYGFSFPYEIVISDNASTDDTTDIVDAFIARGLPIRYYRRPVNHGGGPNLSNAYMQAVGEYLLYHADDDLLIPAGVEAAVRHLDERPDVVAVQAPWTLYNEVEDKDTSQFYKVEQDMTFPRQHFVEVFQYLYEGHVFPEIGIYRASATRSAWLPREICFWAFTTLAHYVDQGAVSFLKQPFYRSVTVSKIAPSRQQGGFDEVMKNWDIYRGGLEYFLHVAAKRGKLNLSDEARAIYDQMCKIFTMIRMSVAIRFLVARHDYIKAYELYTRMAIGGMGDIPEVAQLRQLFPVMVTLQTLVYQVNAASGISHLVLSGVDDPDYIEGLLREAGLEAEMPVIGDASAHDPAHIATSAIFSTDAAEREALEAQGYRPNFIFTESELAHFVLI